MAKKANENDEMLKRLIDSIVRLRGIHEIRWNLISQDKDYFDSDEYIECNELLNEAERKLWKYIDGFD